MRCEGGASMMACKMPGGIMILPAMILSLPADGFSMKAAGKKSHVPRKNFCVKGAGACERSVEAG